MDGHFDHFVTDGDKAHVGKHLLIDLWGIKDVDSDQMCDMFTLACKDAGATVLFTHSHDFGEGCGTTGVIILAESHLSWHHYPECAFIAIDIFVCGQTDPSLALKRIKAFFEPLESDINLMHRGSISDRASYVEKCKAKGIL